MTTKRPDFLVIVADDLGFSDCGCFGSEIQTPNIDQLAQDGLRFTSFHVAAACSPTRAMLMSGTDHHLTGLGQLSEFVRSSPAHQGQPGHEGYLLPNIAALPEILSDEGYLTLMSGKWHLGLKPEYDPFRRGFQKSFALLPGCANHYGWEPTYELPQEPPRFFETAVTALHSEDGEYVSELPNDFYSSDAYANKMIEYLSARSRSGDEKPFFAYLPFSAPHWPLQAPKASVDKYNGMYNDGPDALRARRVASLKAKGLVPSDVTPHKVVVAPGEQADWDTLSAEERVRSSRAMEIYAGMVDRMDENIGRVINHLKQTGEYDNTCIIFMSDNGAEGASYEAAPLLGDQVVEHVQKYYDNSLENMGRGDSFVWYGSRWAQAATAPSRLYKMFSTEGGCRVPFVMKTAGTSIPSAGGVSDTFCTVMDLVPTLLDLASIPLHQGVFRGKPVQPLRGRSWVPSLRELTGGHSDLTKLKLHDDDQVTGWEIAGSGALRKGRYKITFVPAPKGPQRWELFDVIADPGETRDLASEQPDLLKDMLVLWEQYKKDVGVVALAGEFPRGGPPKDEFEDTGKWIRHMAKSKRPGVQSAVPAVL